MEALLEACVSLAYIGEGFAFFFKARALLVGDPLMLNGENAGKKCRTPSRACTTGRARGAGSLACQKRAYSLETLVERQAMNVFP